MQSGESLALRSYGPAGDAHRHAHVQLVLPLRGSMELEVEGRGARVGALQAALVVPGATHAQDGEVGRNCFLVVDCGSGRLPAAALERGGRQPFFTVSPSAQRLLEFVELGAAGRAQLPQAMAGHVLPLLLDALFQPVVAQGARRLTRLCERIRLAPGEPWDVARMAREAGMSMTALHAAFRRELGASPGQWLRHERLRWARHQLQSGLMPLTEIAQQAGFSEQSAFTRAMRRVHGMTPAAMRRQFAAGTVKKRG